MPPRTTAALWNQLFPAAPPSPPSPPPPPLSRPFPQYPALPHVSVSPTPPPTSPPACASTFTSPFTSPTTYPTTGPTYTSPSGSTHVNTTPEQQQQQQRQQQQRQQQQQQQQQREETNNLLLECRYLLHRLTTTTAAATTTTTTADTTASQLQELQVMLSAQSNVLQCVLEEQTRLAGVVAALLERPAGAGTGTGAREKESEMSAAHTLLEFRDSVSRTTSASYTSHTATADAEGYVRDVQRDVQRDGRGRRRRRPVGEELRTQTQTQTLGKASTQVRAQQQQQQQHRKMTIRSLLLETQDDTQAATQAASHVTVSSGEDLRSAPTPRETGKQQPRQPQQQQQPQQPQRPKKRRLLDTQDSLIEAEGADRQDEALARAWSQVSSTPSLLSQPSDPVAGGGGGGGGGGEIQVPGSRAHTQVFIPPGDTAPKVDAEIQVPSSGTAGCSQTTGKCRPPEVQESPLEPSLAPVITSPPSHIVTPKPTTTTAAKMKKRSLLESSDEEGEGEGEQEEGASPFLDRSWEEARVMPARACKLSVRGGRRSGKRGRGFY
ncbi:hypothetical protein BZA05DRAFT_476867 [Tricharina praecox]|uniref:uncharacterized protein n=1 Tax=Tricharina praecox TaxID=43433 RepID=UPI00222074F4|nr:uncharacterized protein BZA05DRAFT_476867 [Tricharina praecox]KAI5844273.1 hypothetical protein BZA05DRAFT_476867 [Tricharina praecox]